MAACTSENVIRPRLTTTARSVALFVWLASSRLCVLVSAPARGAATVTTAFVCCVFCCYVPAFHQLSRLQTLAQQVKSRKPRASDNIPVLAQPPTDEDDEFQDEDYDAVSTRKQTILAGCACELASLGCRLRLPRVHSRAE
jgi:hypothetical protein